MKKILCAVLVVALVACGAFGIVKNNEAGNLKVQVADVLTQLEAANAQVAELEASAADAETLTAELEAANAKVAELEAAAAEAAVAAETAAAEDADLQALVDLYKPFYDAQIIVEFKDGIVLKDDVMAAYDYLAQNYAQYGIDLAQYGLESQVQQQAVELELETAVITAKAVELGLDQMDEAALAEEAKATMESFINTVAPNFQGEDVSEDEVRAQAVEYLASLGYTEEALMADIRESYMAEAVYNHVTGDIAVTDEDVQAAYDALVAEQQELFADDASYNDARNNGELIVYNPESYRAVKQVLIQFSDEQSAKIAELEATLEALTAELEAAQAPAEETEAADEAAESDEIATTDEPAAEPRTVEEIDADIAAAQADLDAVRAELAAEAQEVVDKFNAGTAFADLIAEYNDDPGMNNEPTATNGYAVAATSTTWDPSFTEAAMSIAEVGGISEPTLGSYGMYIVYYESDIPAGPVALDSVVETMTEDALTTKIAQTYNAAVEQWMVEAEPVYHLDRMN